MKVLVTGGSGFLGSRVIKYLVAGGYSVRVLVHSRLTKDLVNNQSIDIVEGDVTNLQAVDKAVSGCEIVMHLAGLYAFYPWWDKKADVLYKVNVEGTRNICSAALKHKVQKFIFTSSIASIGKAPDYSHYAKSKLLAENEVMKFCAAGLPALILNPAIIVGAGDYKPTPSGEIIIKFLHRSYFCYFDALLSIADVDDVAKAHLAAIDKGRIGEKYILSDNDPHSLKEIFSLLEKISGIKAPRIKIPLPILLALVYIEEILSYFIFRKNPLMSSEGVKFCSLSVKLDNSKAIKELGYTITPLRETLTKAVNWYRQNNVSV